MTTAQSFDQVLRSLGPPPEWLLPLPIVHLSIARWFKSIVDSGRLTPRKCDVFNQKLLYFSYGGVHYRTARMQTENAAELPVAFVFKPSVLESIKRYYPFDTGAFSNGRFGDWSKKLGPAFKRKFGVTERKDTTAPVRIVHYMYGTNERYLSGDVDPLSKTRPSPLPELYEFLSADLSSLDVDHRQRMIEGQSVNPIGLGRDLAWIGYPSRYAGRIGPLLNEIYLRHTKPDMPEYYEYGSTKNYNPAEIAHELDRAAAKLINRYQRLPGGK